MTWCTPFVGLYGVVFLRLQCWGTEIHIVFRVTSVGGVIRTTDRWAFEPNGSHLPNVP